MATDKTTLKNNLRAGISPLLTHLQTSLTSQALAGLIDNSEPLTITVVLSRDGVKTQGTLKFGRNEDGVCDWYEPKDYKGPCL